MSEFIKNELYGKTVAFDGDSICQGSVAAGRLPWANLIGDANEMVWKNYGIGGGTITAEVYVASTGAKRHWVTRTIDQIYEQNPTLDYLILEGGTNDADLFKDQPERFGEYSPLDFSGSYDDTTFTGALESLFFKATKYYPTAKLGYIVAQKMGMTNGGCGADDRRRKFFIRAIEICKKWGIPYLDLWERSPLNPHLVCYFDPNLSIDENETQGKCYVDGQHLTALGYRRISSTIESWMRTL